MDFQLEVTLKDLRSLGGLSAHNHATRPADLWMNTPLKVTLDELQYLGGPGPLTNHAWGSLIPCGLFCSKSRQRTCSILTDSPPSTMTSQRASDILPTARIWTLVTASWMGQVVVDPWVVGLDRVGLQDLRHAAVVVKRRDLKIVGICSFTFAREMCVTFCCCCCILCNNNIACRFIKNCDYMIHI